MAELETRKQLYRRELDNWLARATAILVAVRYGQFTYADKLKELDKLQGQLAEVKRRIIFFMNTEDK